MVFTNIARRETQYQSAIANLLEIYEIKNPTLNDKVGVFDDPKLQSLHDDLVAKGMLSLQDALDSTRPSIIPLNAHIRVVHAATPEEMVSRRPCNYNVELADGSSDMGLLFAAYTQDYLSRETLL